MKDHSWLRSLLIFGATTLSAALAANDIELPGWGPESESTYLYPDAGLWPEAALPEGAFAYMKEASAKAKNKKPESTEYVVLREDVQIRAIEPVVDPEMKDDLPPIEKELKTRYFGKMPESYLIDPQNLITEQKANDVLRFLEIHAEESTFKIYPIVIGKHQDIPEDINLKEIHRQWFGDSPAILLAYKIRDPDSLKIVHNDTVEANIPGSILATIRENCIHEAKLADNGADQLEKTAIELSIQAFWLEKLMKRSPLTPVTEVTTQKDNPSPAPVGISDPTARPAELEGIRSIIDDKIRTTFTMKLVRVILVASSAILLIAIILFLKALISKKRTHGRNPVLFPSYTKLERLGGEFTGGTFVGISFEPGRSSGRIE